MKGSLAPEGTVVKQSAIKNKDMLKFENRIIHFHSEQSIIDVLTSDQI
ncbi:MAG: hypothetical protein ACFFA3_09990 [Promethearchaeota archaeon]